GLLVLGFFPCGFQICFIAVHLPAYLVDRGLPAEIGGWTLGVVGLFNIVGAIAAGWLSAFMPKRHLLSLIYFGRAVAILVYITLPPSTAATLIFGAVLGLLWLSTVPPTSGLVTVMFARTGSLCCSALPSSAIRSVVSSACGSAACCSSAPDPTTPCGGSRSCSGFCQRRSTCRLWRSRCSDSLPLRLEGG